MQDDAHDAGRREVIGAGLALVLAPGMASAMTEGSSALRPEGAGGFDFLLGTWRVSHRKLRERLTGSFDWLESPGTLNVRPILGGLGDVDENVIEDPGGRVLATSLRIFNPGSGLWSIYWIDARVPGLDPPLIGRFDGREGRFYNTDTLHGRPIKVRFTYEDIAPTKARWSQAFSPDDGATWETNWTMDFTRTAHA